jgi:chromosome segregation ATPase
MFKSKKIQNLLEENEELKTKFQAIHSKEDNIKNLNEVLKKQRLEVARLNEERRSLKESIDKIRIEEGEKKLAIEKLGHRIGHLNEMRDELQNVILSYTNQIDNIESTLKVNQERLVSQNADENEINEIGNINSDLIDKKKEIEQYIYDAHNKTNKLIEEEADLVKRKESISNEVNQLEEKLLKLKGLYADLATKVNKGNEIIRQLKLEEERLRTELEKKQEEISALEMNLLRLKEEEKILLGKIGKLHSEENSKINKVREIDSVLSEKSELKNSLDQEHLTLMNDLNEKRRILTHSQTEYNKLFEDTKIRKKELFDTEQTLSIKAQKLTNINIDLIGYDKKYSSLKNEITELETFRNDLLMNIQKDKDAAAKFADQNRKLTELVPLLEKRKQEIEQGNVELESRFTIMFQKFNHELNQINRKRSILEQIVLKKEKDVDEKDQLLFEKIAALEESERVLNMRQVELESLEKQVAGLGEHKEIFKTDLIKMEQEALERKNYHDDIRLETELLIKKKAMLEKNLQEILIFMNESFERTKGRNSKFENELNYYEDQIQVYRTRIADSLKELDDIKSAVGSLKIEQEEYRSNISRLSALKKKLHEELTKHQTILQRYQKMREKLKIEQTTGKSFEDLPPKGKIGQSKEVKNPQIYKI